MESLTPPLPSVRQSPEYDACVELIRRPEALILNYSGGKDSIYLVDLFVEAIQNGTSVNKRMILVTSDAVEEEWFQPKETTRNFILRRHAQIEEATNGLVRCHYVRTPVERRFFAKFLGDGEPYPFIKTRWCTKYMKILPIQALVTKVVGRKTPRITVTGRRKAESETRAKTLKRVNPGNLLVYPDRDLKTSLRSDPLQDVANETVVRHALKYGDDSPLNRTGRGCWVCPFIGKFKRYNPRFPQLERLLEAFANTRRVECCVADTPERRAKLDQGMIAGKLKPELRRELLREVLKVQEEVGFELIEAEELAYIERRLGL